MIPSYLGSRFATAAVTALIALGCPLSVDAASIWTAGHGDMRAELDLVNQRFHLGWGLDGGAIVDGAPLSGAVFYAPDELIAHGATFAPVEAAFAHVLGVAQGTQVYTGGANSSLLPYAGFSSTNGFGAGDWVHDEIIISLTGWSSSNPGHVVFIKTDAPFIGDALLFTTNETYLGETYGALYRDVVAPNTWNFPVNTHDHIVLQFSAEGYYELEFTWSGTTAETGDLYEGSGVFAFHVGEITTVPEPGTWVLLGCGVAVLGLVTRRRRLAS